MNFPIVILHGWNSNPDRWNKFKSLLQEKGLEVFIPQLPGFVKDTNVPWSLNDYVEWIIKYMNDKSLARVVLICHSNGGRIGMKLAAGYPNRISHLFLVNSAGIRTVPQWKRKFFELISKGGKTALGIAPFNLISVYAKKLLYKFIREHDYERASPILKKTLVNILEEDLSPMFPNVKTSTTLIWGTDDRLTISASAIKLHQAIPQSKLLWINEAGHALPFTHAEKLAELIGHEMSIH